MGAFDECVRPVPSYICGICRPVFGRWGALRPMFWGNWNGAWFVFSKM